MLRHSVTIGQTPRLLARLLNARQAQGPAPTLCVARGASTALRETSPSRFMRFLAQSSFVRG
jgi:hypothetical protein